MRSVWSELLLAVLALVLLPRSALGAEPDTVRLTVPYRSQLDGDPYQGGNCGPATMGMILAAYGKQVPTQELRALVNDLQGTWGTYDSGTFIENLGVIAERHGLKPLDLFAGTKLRRWTLDDVRGHLQAGHPVVPQVWFRGLPGRENRDYNGDHYIVLTGYEGDDFLYSDSIDSDGPGANRRISATQLENAWRNSDFPYAALAIAGPDGRGSLLPTLTPTPTQTPTPRPTATATASPSPSPTATPEPSPMPPPPIATPTVTGGVAGDLAGLGPPPPLVSGSVLIALLGTIAIVGRRRS